MRDVVHLKSWRYLAISKAGEGLVVQPAITRRAWLQRFSSHPVYKTHCAIAHVESGSPIVVQAVPLIIEAAKHLDVTLRAFFGLTLLSDMHGGKAFVCATGRMMKIAWWHSQANVPEDAALCSIVEPTNSTLQHCKQHVAGTSRQFGASSWSPVKAEHPKRDKAMSLARMRDCSE